MMQCLSKCQLWSALILLAGATAVAAQERVTSDVRAVRRTRPSVGNIHTEKASPQGNAVFNASNGKKINGMGTGIIIDERGYMVTNFHVIADVDTIFVDIEDENRNKSRYVAKRVRVDKEHDLAIIKIDATNSKPFKVMPCGTSSDLMLGEKVIAIGNAYGYDYTVTTGIISALGRDVEANETVSYKRLIQTDAAINPGNSGGPLINAHGEVIGINVAIRANATKIGFAIPIDDARKIIAKMMSIESIDGTFHGLITRDAVEAHNVDETPVPVRMLVVDGHHPDSPAALAGLRVGDVITRAGNVEVFDTVDFERALLHRRANDSVEISFKRNDRSEKASLVLARFPGGRATFDSDIQVTARANNDDADRFWTQLGVKLIVLPKNERNLLGKNSRYSGGMRVVDVKADGPAWIGGIRKGDILVGLAKWETQSVANIDWILDHVPATTDQPNMIRFIVIRAQEERDGSLQVVQHPRTAALGN